MIAAAQRQSLLFFTPLAQQITLLKDDLLDPVDHLLDDQELVDRVRACLIGRHPNSSPALAAPASLPIASCAAASSST